MIRSNIHRLRFERILEFLVDHFTFVEAVKNGGRLYALPSLHSPVDSIKHREPFHEVFHTIDHWEFFKKLFEKDVF
ncbi:hypothetical protein RvY_16158 [Ramazzottius varieornatus]|uniref:Uncharacterized protein n=1 Tax=Ramazzottius varieornatus TaxID=947166 RepID=A0A1D1VXG7_RAMVA|nr:hypothetical protein RvY_16158 [Ramazzottius varieornatus]